MKTKSFICFGKYSKIIDIYKYKIYAFKLKKKKLK